MKISRKLFALYNMFSVADLAEMVVWVGGRTIASHCTQIPLSQLTIDALRLHCNCHINVTIVTSAK